MSSKIVNHNETEESKLSVLLESFSQDQLLAIIAEMSKEEMIAFITENYNYALNAELYSDEDEFVNWCFDIALDIKHLRCLKNSTIIKELTINALKVIASL